jgi:hypothetical protein
MIRPELLARVRRSLEAYVRWLDTYGPYSQDHQDFFASRVGRAAKALYYKSKLLGTMAVAPMVFCEAFLPSVRRFFHKPMRLPISDAHFAMGFALLYRTEPKPEYLQRADAFLQALEETRCPGYVHAGWGYPFDWETRRGVIKAWTPLITTTPYCYEAFEYRQRIEETPGRREMLRSIAEHAFNEYHDVVAGPNAATCTYTPHDGAGVVNASAYRAGLLALSSREFGEQKYLEPAERNVNFVLQAQRPDGSWPYAVDGVRDFVDHFHTCFVLKGLAKYERITADARCTEALDRGVHYYLANLFDEQGLPRPFSKAPRLTVYQRELYDCAECLNLGVLLEGRFPELDATVERVVEEIVSKWQQRSGSFRSRKLILGYDNVPMHRWGGSEMFRSLSLLSAQAAGHDVLRSPGDTVARGD